MLFHTQTHLTPHGNCWQTAIACILEVPPEALPDQHEIESRAGNDDADDYAGHHSYSNALQCYLAKHHGVQFFQEPAWKMARFVITGPHLFIGPTVRTVEIEDQPRILHSVVAFSRSVVWDPHPSRAGLTRNKYIAWLATITEDAEHIWSQNAARHVLDRASWANRHERRAGVSSLCCCPLCFEGGEYL